MTNMDKKNKNADTAAVDAIRSTEIEITPIDVSPGRNIIPPALHFNAVRDIFVACAYPRTEKPAKGSKTVDSISGLQVFKTPELEKHREEIKAMLRELPDKFHAPESAGFQSLTMHRNGTMWCGSPDVLEMLCMLGMAIDCLSYTLPRELWPNGLPYIQVNIPEDATVVGE